VSKVVYPKHITDIEGLEMIWGPPQVIRSESDLRPYQVWMADKIEEVGKVFLAAEMGLGKTAACLRAIVRLLDQKKVRQVLIVAPLAVAEETWPAEIAGWDFARKLKYRIVTGTEAERIAALRYGPCNVTIINRENLVWLYNRFGPVRWPYDMVVYDEATRLKSGRLKTAARNVNGVKKSTGRKTDLGVLHKVRSTIRYLVELSGTPAPKGLIDLWGPIYAIDGGKRLGLSMRSYKERWFREKKYGYGVEPMPHSHNEIMSRISDVFFSLREEDYLKLPPMVIQDHILHMEPALMKRYREFEREAAIFVRDNKGSPEVIRALNEGVLTGKLLQFANGSLYREDGSHVKLHEKKLDRLESIMEEAAGKPVLVAYSFQFDREAIAKRFRYARFFGDSKNDMRDWNEGRIRMLVTHPASAGHGLNFQHGSNIAVWYGLTWAMELYKQFIKRLHRSGQKADRVFVHRILMAGTADEDVAKVLSQRVATQDAITDAVRVRLNRALKAE
jgi:hypothetical protein